MSTETSRPQDANAKTVNRTTFYLSIIITFFATLVITTIGTWFVYEIIHTDARAAVVQDMQIVSKAQSR